MSGNTHHHSIYYIIIYGRLMRCDVLIQVCICSHVGASSPTQAYFGAGTGPIWLDNLLCSGTELRLADCPANPLGMHNCNHNEDASVRCIPAYSKLINQQTCHATGVDK